MEKQAHPWARPWSCVRPPRPGATRRFAQASDDLRRQLDPPGAVRPRLDCVQDTRLAPGRDGRDIHIEPVRGHLRATTAIRSISLGRRGWSVGTATWNGIRISELLHNIRRESLSRTGAEPLLIEHLGDLAVGRVGRQGPQSRHGGGVGPPHIARTPGTGNTHNRTGFGLPTDRHLDRRFATGQADILDQASDQLFPIRMGRRRGLPQCR